MGMRLGPAAVLLASCLVGCGQDRSITLPPPPATTAYTATLSASSACAGKLPAGEAVRVYEVTMSEGGVLQWTAPTIHQARADQRSSLKIDGGAVSLVIGSGWPDPRDDIFYGIWEEVGGAGTLTVYGHGSGRVEGFSMSGTFEGDFDSWGTNVPGVSCHAANHHFTFVPR
jgi:hypothetical protein